MNALKKLLSDERAQTALEYGLIIALGVVLAGVLAYTGKNLLKQAPKDVIEEGVTGIEDDLTP